MILQKLFWYADLLKIIKIKCIIIINAETSCAAQLFMETYFLFMILWWTESSEELHLFEVFCYKCPLMCSCWVFISFWIGVYVSDTFVYPSPPKMKRTIVLCRKSLGFPNTLKVNLVLSYIFTIQAWMSFQLLSVKNAGRKMTWLNFPWITALPACWCGMHSLNCLWWVLY